MTATNKLILISEDRVSVKAECLNCNKVLQIEKKNLHSLGDQFKFRNSITCLCGNVYFDITLDKKPLTNISDTSSKKLNTKEFPETKNKGCLYVIIFAVFIVGLILINRDDSSKKITHNPEEAKQLLEINAIKKAEENATTDFSIRTKTHEEKINDARLEGIKALQELDTTIRDDISNRRNALEKAAVKHEHNNGQGLPATVDLYTMKDGRLILCTTSISATGAIMNCDGEP